MSSEDYLKVLKARRSMLPVEQRIELIKRCLPVWIMTRSEQYMPKPFQEYKAHDVKDLHREDDGSANLIPYDDTSHHSRLGENNTVRLDASLLSGEFRLGGHKLQSLYPRSAPTYAFYLETSDGEIWIRYYLFFGYNYAPYFGLIGVGNHFADWVHITVKLVRDGERGYVPRRYFFSSHQDGRAYDENHDDLRYYVKGDRPPAAFEYRYDPRRFEDLPEDGPWHVRVFCAEGTHECYADAGLHSFVSPENNIHQPDVTDYGYCVIPFLVGFGQADANPGQIATDSKLRYAPVYAWDMSDPSVQDLDPSAWCTTAENGLFVVHKPRLLLPDWSRGDSRQDTTGDFAAIWVTQRESLRGGHSTGDFVMRPIRNCGKTHASAPSFKIFDWAGKFDN
ncbi:hypothetical protein [Nannocystis sp. SCPEA4]|uniref:hypothetical protein n=1 Tax=Nannocystis sp. SCPEA4 TaxID=2996787 RepID=UPI00226D5045|nr:hypothetical protein [Nannocystis sp. SCPEA4]MCY1060290.1 hypothetical protein [Nannocystis sp. SCPEA4]